MGLEGCGPDRRLDLWQVVLDENGSWYANFLVTGGCLDCPY